MSMKFTKNWVAQEWDLKNRDKNRKRKETEFIVVTWLPTEAMAKEHFILRAVCRKGEHSDGTCRGTSTSITSTSSSTSLTTTIATTPTTTATAKMITPSPPPPPV